MKVHKYLLASLFAINTLCLGLGVLAAAPAGAAVSSTKTTADYIQDKDLKRDQDRQDAIQNRDDTKQDAQVAKNTEDTYTNTSDISRNAGAIEKLQDLSGNQQFILQLLAIVMPLLSLMATGLIAFYQFKARNERQEMAEESRHNLGQMGRSINGMKTELVAVVKAAAFLEGLSHGTEGKTDTDSLATLRKRVNQLAKEAEDASLKAAETADEAVRQIETKPTNSP